MRYGEAEEAQARIKKAGQRCMVDAVYGSRARCTDRPLVDGAALQRHKENDGVV
jgi:hypothetical protein